MEAAALQGIYNMSSSPIFHCPGACTWNNSYVSLGFKSICKNVTAATLKTQVCSKSEVTRTCNMTTPEGITISTIHVETDLHTTFRLNATSTLEDTAVDLSNKSFPAVVKLAVYRSTSDHNFNAMNINVTKCALSLTSYRYSHARANDSDFSFQKVERIDLPRDRWNIDTGNGWFNGRLWTNASKAEDLPELSIGWADLKALQFFFTSDTLVTEWVDGNWYNKNYGISTALIGDVDLPGRFDMMAKSMTDYLRNGPNHETVTGYRVESKVYVSIRWLWFIGPITIELLAVLFAVGTLLNNRESCRVPLWKSSALAMLACRYEEESELIRSDLKDIKEIEKTAEIVNGRLE